MIDRDESRAREYLRDLKDARWLARSSSERERLDEKIAQAEDALAAIINGQ